MQDRSTTPLQNPLRIVALSGLELTLSSAAGAVEILRGIDVEIGPGEQVALVGASGAGKSSMMMIIGGLERASAGSVRVAGYDLNGMSEDELALFRRANVGIADPRLSVPDVVGDRAIEQEALLRHIRDVAPQ